MINRSKIKEDVLDYQLRTIAIRDYLNTVPESPRKSMELKVVPRGRRRPRTAFERLALSARAIPFLIAVACFAFVWAGQKATPHRAPVPEAQSMPRPLNVDPLLAQSLEPKSDDETFGNPQSPVALPLPAILMESTSPLASRNDEVPAMGTN